MLDPILRPVIDPIMDRFGEDLAERGATADIVTLAGLGLGVVAALLISVGLFWMALFFLLASRLADGLDGAVARATRKTDFGGYLDIVCDFAFYGLIPLGFILYDPAANGLVGAFLLLTFYINGASFLGYSVLAEKRGLVTRARGLKSLYYSAGLLEGTETIAFFVVICLWPGSFVWLGSLFALLTLATTVARMLLAQRVFGDTPGA